MLGLEAWENELFDRYNGEYFDQLEFEADCFDELDHEYYEEEKNDKNRISK